MEHLESAYHGAEIRATLLNGGTVPATIDVHEIVHAAIVFGHHDDEVRRNAIERRIQFRLECSPSSKRELFFSNDAAIGEVDEQVLHERAQRNIIAVLPATRRNGDGAAGLIVAERNERLAGVDLTGRGGYRTQAERELRTAVDAAVEGGTRAAGGNQGGQCGAEQRSTHDQRAADAPWPRPLANPAFLATSAYSGHYSPAIARDAR